MTIDWSAAALAGLDRFAAFLHDRHSRLAAIVAREILAKARILELSPELGYSLSEDTRYRQIVLEVLREVRLLPRRRRSHRDDAGVSWTRETFLMGTSASRSSARSQ